MQVDGIKRLIGFEGVNRIDASFNLQLRPVFHSTGIFVVGHIYPQGCFTRCFGFLQRRVASFAECALSRCEHIASCLVHRVMMQSAS